MTLPYPCRQLGLAGTATRALALPAFMFRTPALAVHCVVTADRFLPVWNGEPSPVGLARDRRQPAAHLTSKRTIPGAHLRIR